MAEPPPRAQNETVAGTDKELGGFAGERSRDARQDEQRGERGLELENDDRGDDREDDQEPAQRRVHPREERPHVPVMYARTASAPATRVAPANQPSRARRSAGAYIQGASTARSESVPYRE